MRRILYKVRQKSPQFRLAVALSLAFVMTGVIATLWSLTLSSPGSEKQKDQAPSPLNALLGSFKKTVSPQPTSQSETGITTVEIIDANAANKKSDPNPNAYDETNPYQTTSQ